MHFSMVIFACGLGLVFLSAGCGDSNSGPRDGGQSADAGAAGADAGATSDGQAAPDLDGGDAAGASGEDAADGGDICGLSPFEATQREVNVLLVIDKSGSMADTPEGFSDDKWTAMKVSLQAALDKSKRDLSFGLELFPMPRGCEMPAGSEMDVTVHAGTTSVSKIMDKLNKVLPGGGTPTAVALDRALEYFTAGDGAGLEGDSYVLLATDGGPNCNGGIDCKAGSCTVNLDGQCPAEVANCCDPDQAGEGAQEGCLDQEGTLDRIEALAAAGIPTFVVGIPGSEDYAELLDRMARAGGAANPSAPPSYFAVSASGGAEGLAAVLTSITTELITTCRFQLDSQPPDLGKLNVELDGELVPQAGDDGWEIDVKTDPPTIEIKGTTCERIESEGAESVKVVYGCPTLIIE